MLVGSLRYSALNFLCQNNSLKGDVILAFWAKLTISLDKMKQLRGFLPQDLQDKVQRLERYDAVLESVLAAPLSTHVKVTQIHANKLCLLADTQTWANNLQYYKKDLAKRFTDATGIPIQSVSIRIDTCKGMQRKEQAESKTDQAQETNPDRLRLRKLLREL